MLPRPVTQGVAIITKVANRSLWCCLWFHSLKRWFVFFGVCLVCKPLTQQCARSLSLEIPMAAAHQQRVHEGCFSSPLAWNYLAMCLSLVPRPSHCPVLISSFDCLQYAKWGRPGPFYHVNDIDVYLDKQRGEGHSNRESAHFLCSVQQAQLFFRFVNILNSNTWINTTRNGLKHALLSRSPSPSLSR